MSQQVLIWIMGICVILLAAAMATQALAGFQILRILKPLLVKQRQLTNESKQLKEAAGNTIRDVRPKLLGTYHVVRDLAETTARRASEWKQGVEQIPHPWARLRKSSARKPKRIRTNSAHGEPARPKIGEGN
jgi:hypothetical protein